MKRSIKKNKKGMFFNVYLVILTIIVLTTVLIRFHNKLNINPEERIGVKQYSLVKTEFYSEKELTYADYSAKLALNNAIIEAAKSGGVSNPDCPKYSGFVIYGGENSDCTADFASAIEENAEQDFDIFKINSPHKSNVEYDLSVSSVGGTTYFVGLAKSEYSSPILTSRQARDQLQTFENEFASNQLKADIPDEKNLVSIKTGFTNIRCLNDCKAVPELANALKKVDDIARRENVKLRIDSSYRPIEKQEILYKCYLDRKKTGVCSKDCGSCNVASQPGKSPHERGLAVDIKVDGGKNMLTSFKPTVVSGFSDREQLEKIMCEAGFVRWTDEFWHFEYGTNRWTRQQEMENKKCALS